MFASSRVRTARRHSVASTVALALTVALAIAGSAVAASNSIHVKATKKQLTFTGSAATRNETLQVNFDPNRCAATYSAETRRKHVAFTDFPTRHTGHFKFKVKLPIPPPQGGRPGHHACAYLLKVNGNTVKQVASASAKY
jgi:hypothetical protein